MFWDKGYTPSQNIEALLEKENATVEEFLDDEDILQECKSLKKALVNYFTRPDVIKRLVELSVTEPSEELPLARRFRHANMACEILTLGLPTLDEKILADGDTLKILYSYLENEPPLNPLLASFFSKIFSMLFTKKAEQDWFLYQQMCLKLLEYIKSENNFLDLVCKHFSMPVIPDLIMQMMKDVQGGQLKRNLYEWLTEDKLVERLIAMLGNREEFDKHSNIAEFLCDLIQHGHLMRQTEEENDSFEPAFVGSNPLLHTIESKETVEALLNVILEPNAQESAIVSGITVVLYLIKPVALVDEPKSDRLKVIHKREKCVHEVILTTVIGAIAPRLKDFHELLQNPPNKPDIVTPAAKLSPPFGMIRLQICRLFTVLLQSKNEDVLKTICETDFFQTILTLFKQYCWNNFLHSEVEKCLQMIFYTTLQNNSSTQGSTIANDGSFCKGSNNGDVASSIFEQIFKNGFGGLLDGARTGEYTNIDTSGMADRDCGAVGGAVNDHESNIDNAKNGNKAENVDDDDKENEAVNINVIKRRNSIVGQRPIEVNVTEQNEENEETEEKVDKEKGDEKDEEEDENKQKEENEEQKEIEEKNENVDLKENKEQRENEEQKEKEVKEEMLENGVKQEMQENGESTQKETVEEEGETNENETTQKPSVLQTHVIINCKVISKLIDCWQYNKDLESGEKGRRLGYMGHLIKIFKHITNCISEFEHIGALIETSLSDSNELDLWQSIIDPLEGDFTKALATQNKMLANCNAQMSSDFTQQLSKDFLCNNSTLDYVSADVLNALNDSVANDIVCAFKNDLFCTELFENNDNGEADLNLFQFCHHIDDDDEYYEGDSGTGILDLDGVVINPWDNYDPDDNTRDVLAFLLDTSNFADFNAHFNSFTNDLGESLTASTKENNAKEQEKAANTDFEKAFKSANAAEYDNNANVEKSLSSIDFFNFEDDNDDEETKNDKAAASVRQSTIRSVLQDYDDDFGDDDGMWTKPLGTTIVNRTNDEEENPLTNQLKQTASRLTFANRATSGNIDLNATWGVTNPLINITPSKTFNSDLSDVRVNIEPVVTGSDEDMNNETSQHKNSKNLDERSEVADMPNIVEGVSEIVTDAKLAATNNGVEVVPTTT